MAWNTKMPLIAILRGITPDEIHTHIPLLIEAGFDAIEIPLNSPDWQISIQQAVQHYGHQALIGAGTVLRVENVDQLAELGCRLIVTPNIHTGVIRKAIEYGMTVCPGCFTATEAFTALEAGSPNLKIFPSATLGPDYVKALKAVLPADISVFAVGGVTPENLHTYLNAGCVGAGLGGDLYKAGQSAERTKQQAEAFIHAYQQWQQQQQ
ncbi:2-dehydro-3-deoxy-6-phosphogalactonate aldolase [Pragia fontium]|uniref:2-dehydro-3-deoxy-6-phosphogalactonate aldolase n=1 Tax=Pragia fontium TaxID=82985 RepID=A0ABQ5LD18_9GAMM|nr:2-dehydro-3-deoxy-6-phosphogalactonate aldolase [Pragia fontium]AKJ42384.1 2-dehydro-3-deoxy-6-phosphogalactonate aldolase [Pragia fontium]GKX61521.1 2-dehydro-3-deoxy-6-phosphogalactonate aldolase [Pragia fontium]SUB82676.1 2-dehydro-3-deoxy-6-phosphogalactonate aldolase [Pragia fontium]